MLCIGYDISDRSEMEVHIFPPLSPRVVKLSPYRLSLCSYTATVSISVSSRYISQSYQKNEEIQHQFRRRVIVIGRCVSA